MLHNCGILSLSKGILRFLWTTYFMVKMWVIYFSPNEVLKDL